MKMLKAEWAKMQQMNFTEKRQYVWEYYKLHIFAVLFLGFMVGSLLNTWIFNPPHQEYLYFVWVGHPIAAPVLDGFADGLSVIVENPDRFVVRATNYSLDGLDPQMAMGLQTRFMAQLQMSSLDLFMVSEEELYIFSANGFVLPIMQFMDELAGYSPAAYDALSERLVEISFYSEEDATTVTDYMAASMRGIPFFEQFHIDTEDLYMAVIINSVRFERVARALEVILDV